MSTETSKYQGHTPGPWTLEMELYNGYRVISDPGGDQVIEWDANDVIPTEPDARLIADAPELLRQRDELLEALEGIIAALTQPKTFDADIECARSYARAAIARARGGE